MTEEQEKTFLWVAQVGVTAGFHHLLDWLGTYAELDSPQFFPDGKNGERIQKAFEAMAAFLDTTGPRENSWTVEELSELIAKHRERCCFPGCWSQGVFKVRGKENTGLRLCVQHEGCVGLITGG